MKGCQKAGHSIGRIWHGGKPELRDPFGRNLACCLFVCAGLSLIVARGNYDVVSSQEQGHYMEKGEVLTLAGESGDCHQREG
jgi:hypothetical protein